MNKSDATEAPKKYHLSLDEAVEYLQECRKRGLNFYLDFNGHKLYSCDVTIDSAYMEVVGMTKAEDAASKEEFKRATTEEQREAIIKEWSDLIEKHKRETPEERDSIVKEWNNIRKTQKGIIESVKNSAIEAEEKYHLGLDETVEYLQECKRRGLNVYVDFNGHRLYSCDVTMDSAYMEVVGMTRSEDVASKEEFKKATTDEARKEVIARWSMLQKRYQSQGNQAPEKSVDDGDILM